MKRIVPLVAGYILMLAAGLVVPMTGLVAPIPAPIVFGVIWFGFAVLAVVRRDKPWLVLALPFIFFALLIAMLTFGDLVLGWTA